MSCQNSENLWKSLRECSSDFVQQFLKHSISGLPELSKDACAIYEISDFIIGQMLMELKTYSIDTVFEFPIQYGKEGE